jgi:hypothetical protein
MTFHFSEVIRGWLGWCPNSHAQVHTGIITPEHDPVIPSGRGSLKTRAIHWIGLFRNQIILSSLAMPITGFWMFAGLGGGSEPVLFIIGILAVLPASAATGNWYWRIFDEVLCNGPVVLMNRRDRTTRILTTLSFAVALIPVLVLFGVLPGVTMTMMIAFMGGFVAVPFWGMVIAIQKWETGNHCRLHYDGMILQLEKEGEYAIR